MIALLLMACFGTTEPDIEPGGLPFPHPEGFEEAHGDALAAFPESCVSCHRDDGGAPSCASCHEAYPHPVGWLAGAVHGIDAHGAIDGGEAGYLACQKCHGAEGRTTASCSSCHGSYPHAEGWADAGQHGAYAQQRGSAVAACGSCHGGALEGTATAPSCTSCHEGFPHAEGWVEGHRAADLSTCASCHGELGAGGSSGVACARCHPAYPHPADATQAHIASADTRGEGACLGCHEAGDGPATMPATCGGTCHGGAP